MNGFANSLRKEVLTCKIKDFTLENDLKNLDRVNASGATEAVVFYSARILEALIKHAHTQIFDWCTEGLNNRSLVLADMEQLLFDYNLLTQSRYYWAKGLRLLGNEVRHNMRRINQSEADVSLLFLEFILTWYFCEFPLGLCQTTIHKGQAFQPQTTGNLLINLAWTLNSSRLNSEKLKIIFGNNEQEYLKAFAGNFTFPLLLIEIFIARGDRDSARRLVDLLAYDGQKQKGVLKARYQQLNGLLFSREDKLEDALAILEPGYLQQKQKPDKMVRIDDELIGILSGVYKRIWERDNSRVYLEKSHESYSWGWRRSHNTYLGINAAATAFWLNKRGEALKTAEHVKEILVNRRDNITRKSGGAINLNYWDAVTLAEACLLSNEHCNAYEQYATAFVKFGNLSDSIASTRQQLAELLKSMDMESSIRTKFDEILRDTQ